MGEIEKQKDRELLRELIAGEHAAIVQYMAHRYYFGENEIGAEVEEVARREMLHWKWLNERLVQIGGQPVLDRSEMDLERKSAVEMLQADVELEIHCAEEYTRAIEMTDDPALKRQFQHHLRDEYRHKAIFEHLVEEATEAEEKGETLVADTPEEKNEIINQLNRGVSHEYGAVLQYLHQSHATKDLPLSQSLLNAAIDEMKHISLLADEVVEMGGKPTLHPAPYVTSESDQQRLRDNIEDEQAARLMYAEQMETFSASGRHDLNELINFIRDQETFHLEDFEDLLEQRAPALASELEPGQTQQLKLTVGSLLGLQPDNQETGGE